MNETPEFTPDLERRAKRTRTLIQWVMGFLILLPFILAWIFGAIRFY